MLVLISGDRHWADRSLMEAEMRSRLKKGDIVLHGAARGADTMAAEIAGKMGLEVRSEPADWNRYGRRAGMIRNRVMLDMNPGFVMAFHKDLNASRGTRDCVLEALRRGITVWTSSPLPRKK